MTGRVRAAALLLACPLALAVAGCGEGGSGGDGAGDAGRAPERLTLLLDFTPNPVHAGIYSAVARGLDRDASIALDVRAPSASSDSVRLLAAGRVDAAVLDIHDLGLAREAGADLIGIFAIVQRPLASVLAQPGIATPRDLEGRRAGVTGLPSDVAVLDSIVRGAGGDPDTVEQVTIGFNAVGALLSRRVAGATAFWNAEGVALARARPGTRVFRVDEFGAPSYPELVVAVTRETLEQRRDRVERLVTALRLGYEFTIERPLASLTDLLAAAPGLQPELTAAQLRAVLPALRFGDEPVGALDPRRLAQWAAWDVRFGILERPPDVDRAFELGLASGTAGQVGG